MTTAVTKKTIVFAEDMTDEMVEEATKVAADAVQAPVTRGKPFTVFAEYIRAHFDKLYGRGWNCVVGTSFAAHVTHEIKTYIYFQIEGLSILLWKMS